MTEPKIARGRKRVDTRTYKGVTMTILMYYHYLREMGYSYMMARSSVLMRYCPTADDLYRRMRRYGK